MKAMTMLILTALLVGCAGLTFDQKLQNGYDTNEAYRDTATLSLNAERITSVQAENLRQRTQAARHRCNRR